MLPKKKAYTETEAHLLTLISSLKSQKVFDKLQYPFPFHIHQH